ncbi:MAG: hypothetical protein JOZ63_09325 [Planctomycetaceae bacterium]|nr:hypothetical protein [Planctomycetaceae bacterium]
MSTFGVLLLAAATAGDGFGYDKPYVGLKKLLRPHVVVDGPPPPGGPIVPGAAGAGACAFGHPGCQGGAACPGPGGPGGGPAGGRRFPNVKSQVYFLDPDGMRIGWQTGAGAGERVYLAAQLIVPARYNFLQGYIYRLKLTDIPGRPGVQLYPTIEVAPATPATDAYLTHNPIPLQFTAEDFDQVIDGGNFVTKVIYLPDPKYQELAIAGVETLVSTRLEPGVDPILEADKRGTILMIVRLGAIDLEMPTAGGGMVVAPGAVVPPGAVIGPNGAIPSQPGVAPGTVVPPGAVIGPNGAIPSQPGVAPGTVLPPGALPPGAVPTPTIESVPVDTAPVTPAPTVPGAPTPPPAAAPTPPPPVPSLPAPGEPPAPATPPATPAPAPGEASEPPK